MYDYMSKSFGGGGGKEEECIIQRSYKSNNRI
jgi:hypothetical protein